MKAKVGINIILSGDLFIKGERATLLERRANMLLIENSSKKGWVDKRNCVTDQEIDDGVFSVKITGKMTKENVKELLSDIADEIQNTLYSSKPEKRVTNNSLVACIQKILK